MRTYEPSVAPRYPLWVDSGTRTTKKIYYRNLPKDQFLLGVDEHRTSVSFTWPLSSTSIEIEYTFLSSSLYISTLFHLIRHSSLPHVIAASVFRTCSWSPSTFTFSSCLHVIAALSIISFFVAFSYFQAGILLLNLSPSSASVFATEPFCQSIFASQPLFYFPSVAASQSRIRR